VPNASQFSASATEGVGSYKASACIGTVEGSILRTSGCRPASHLLARLEEKSWRTRLQFLQEIPGRGRNWTRDMSVRRTTCSIDGHSCRNVSRKMETMGSSRNNAKKPMKIDKQGFTPESSAVEENGY
jgi:hypothetical protein